MKPLRDLLDKIEPLFVGEGKFARLYPLYEAADTFLFTPGDTTKGLTHVRDNNDLKRIMGTVALALGPCVLWGMYNIGLQANTALANMNMAAAEGWRGAILSAIGIGFNAGNPLANLLHGALYFIPIFLVANIAGGLAEVAFSIVRKHEINEGFLVTGMLYPLTLPPNIPLWQVAIGIIFAVVIAKEIFGGTGKNFLNIALTARAFLYFAYPAQISGDSVWTAVDGFSGATPLGLVAAEGMSALQSNMTWFDAFFGTIQGSIGETSFLACMFGLAVLIVTGVGSWQIVLSVFVGAIATAAALNHIGSDTNLMFQMPWHWHMVVGSLAFGAVFMATDPVSASMTSVGKWIYGALIGFMTVLIRVVNPAFPEGVMLAILFGNVFAPTIDYYVVKAHIKRRRLRHG